MLRPVENEDIEAARQKWLGVLEGLSKFDVPWERSQRFHAYIDVLQQVVNLDADRAAGSPDAFSAFRANRKNQELLFEGTSQLLQLEKASQSFSRLDPLVLGRKLKKVLRGSLLPDEDRSSADDPRDTLVELQAVALFEDCGFAAEITDNGEDIRLRLPGGEAVLVECKRPASKESIPNVVGKLKRQLWRRTRKAEGNACIAVIAIERTCQEALVRRVAVDAEAEDLANAEVNKSAADLSASFQERRMSPMVPAFLVTYSTAFFVSRPAGFLYPMTTSVPYYPEPHKVPSWLRQAFDSRYQRYPLP